MNNREFATDLCLSLFRIRCKLDDIENCEDGHEMIAIAQELSADISGLEDDLDNHFDLRMDEE